MQFLDAQKALCRKLDIDFDNISLNGLFTLEDVKAYLNEAGMEAWDLASWDFAEESQTGTLSSTDVTNGYIPHPPTFAPSSIFLVTVDGKEHTKIDMQDFLKEFELRSGSTSKIWAEYKRLMFLNKNLISVGTVVDVWGKLLYTSLSDDTDLMPFSPTTDTDQLSGNNAIVRLAYAKALGSEKKRNPQQAAIEEKGAYTVLGALKNQADIGKSAEKSQRPMFDAPDYFGRGSRGVTPSGTFTWNSNN